LFCAGGKGEGGLLSGGGLMSVPRFAADVYAWGLEKLTPILMWA